MNDYLMKKKKNWKEHYNGVRNPLSSRYSSNYNLEGIPIIKKLFVMDICSVNAKEYGPSPSHFDSSLDEFDKLNQRLS